jgi:HEAT repeat protein
LRRSAIRALGRLGIEEAIEEITPALDDPETAEAAAIALLLLGDRRGVAFHAQLLVDAEESRGGFPGEIVGRYGDPSYLLLLIATARREGEASLGAMQGLGYLGDMRAVPHLIEILGRHDPRAVEVAAGALEILTGHRVPIYEPGLKTGWTRFWEQAESRFAAGLRYRFGCLLDPGFLIEKLGDDDANVRGAAYDELVITSGQRLPFDVEGPWRVQVHHRAHWTRWWSSARVDFPSGRWTFHGQVTG